MRLGIDVGRATTAAVVVGPGGIEATALAPSSSGLGASLRAVLRELPPTVLATVASVCVATDLDRTAPRLRPVTAVRIGPPCHPALAPFAGWPADVVDPVRGHVAIVGGGSSLTGRRLAPLDRAALAETARRAADAGTTFFAVTGAGSLTRPEHELQAAELLADTVRDARISLSHEIGRIGLRERENATVLNAALQAAADALVEQCRAALKAAGVRAPLLLARDAGGAVSAEYFRRFPVVATQPTVACALLGAAADIGADQAIVVDAGASAARCGTVTATGLERHEGGPGLFGLLLGLDLPAVASVPLGTGTKDLSAQAGAADTAERLAVLVGRSTPRLPQARRILAGGAADLLGPDAGELAPHAAHAAALGAAHAHPMAEFEQVIVAGGREELAAAVALVQDQALSRVVAAGAAPESAQVSETTQAPVSYLPEGVHRIRVRAVGAPATIGDPAQVAR
jgi:hypothetical protein